MEKQIKSKRRVSDFGEVYTARKQVTDMVDLVDSSASDITTTVLEPACGNGNFLVEILARKMNTIQWCPISLIRYERETLRAVASIYGVDIQKDNTIECRERLFVDNTCGTCHVCFGSIINAYSNEEENTNCWRSFINTLYSVKYL